MGPQGGTDMGRERTGKSGSWSGSDDGECVEMDT